MNHITMSYIIPNNLEEELNQIEQIAANFAEQLLILEGEVKYLFSQIKVCETMEKAEDHFNLLDKIQSTLAIIVHKYEFGIPDRLWRFMKDFDNFQEEKIYYFHKITSGEYTF